MSLKRTLTKLFDRFLEKPNCYAAEEIEEHEDAVGGLDPSNFFFESIFTDRGDFDIGQFWKIRKHSNDISRYCFRDNALNSSWSDFNHGNKRCDG